MIKRFLCFIGSHDWFVISGHDGGRILSGTMKCLRCPKMKTIGVIDGKIVIKSVPKY